MRRPLQMTKEEMREGFKYGRSLTQEEWAHLDEIKWVDELIAEGAAEVTANWEYTEQFQGKCRVVTGTGDTRTDKKTRST